MFHGVIQKVTLAQNNNNNKSKKKRGRRRRINHDSACGAMNIERYITRVMIIVSYVCSCIFTPAHQRCMSAFYSVTIIIMLPCVVVGW